MTSTTKSKVVAKKTETKVSVSSQEVKKANPKLKAENKQVTVKPKVEILKKPVMTDPKVVINGRAVSMRGRQIIGLVVSDRMQNTVSVQVEWKQYIPKFERYQKRRNTIKAHNTLGAKTGDKVRIKETRPISKTKKFVVVEVLK